MERIYLVLVKTDEDYEHPDWGWYGIVHDLSLAGAYTDLNDAKNKKDELIKEGVWYGSIEIQPIHVNINMSQDEFICLSAIVEYYSYSFFFAKSRPNWSKNRCF